MPFGASPDITPFGTVFDKTFFKPAPQGNDKKETVVEPLNLITPIKAVDKKKIRRIQTTDFKIDDLIESEKESPETQLVESLHHDVVSRTNLTVDGKKRKTKKALTDNMSNKEKATE